MHSRHELEWMHSPRSQENKILEKVAGIWEFLFLHSWVRFHVTSNTPEGAVGCSIGCLHTRTLVCEDMHQWSCPVFFSLSEFFWNSFTVSFGHMADSVFVGFIRWNLGRDVAPLRSIEVDSVVVRAAEVTRQDHNLPNPDLLITLWLFLWLWLIIHGILGAVVGRPAFTGQCDFQINTRTLSCQTNLQVFHQNHANVKCLNVWVPI